MNAREKGVRFGEKSVILLLKNMKKATEKKSAEAKAPAKKTATKTAAKVPAKKAAAAKKTAAAKKPCAEKKAAKGCCGKGGCACKKAEAEAICAESLVSEIFSQLEDTEVLSALLGDFFFCELVKRGVDEQTANDLANKLNIDVEAFEANIELGE